VLPFFAKYDLVHIKELSSVTASVNTECEWCDSGYGDEDRMDVYECENGSTNSSMGND
jgi:hypothetical protein